MKNITEYSIQASSIDNYLLDNLVVESWNAERKDYAKELQDILDKYEKRKNAKPKKSRFGYPLKSAIPSEVFIKYPMQILIDKAGYTPKEITQTTYSYSEKTHTTHEKQKQVFSKIHYGQFIADELEKGNLNIEDMIKWWQEYDEEVAKNNWHDPKYIVKQIDVTRLWNPYYPKDDSVVTALLNEPARISRYAKPKRATTSEMEDFKAFLSDPANQDTLKAALKSIKGTIMKARPTFATGVENHVKEIIENCDYSDGDLKELMEKEYQSSHKRYYEGPNDRDCEASAVIGLILKALNEMYGFEVWSSIQEIGEEDRSWKEYETKINIKGSVDDKTLEGFLDDADHLKFKIEKLGASEKKRSSGVYSSSFSNYYDYDFDVICEKNGEEVYHSKFKNITIGSYFYSGGWN
jgi:hypothetical protein